MMNLVLKTMNFALKMQELTGAPDGLSGHAAVRFYI